MPIVEITVNEYGHILGLGSDGKIYQWRKDLCNWVLYTQKIYKK